MASDFTDSRVGLDLAKGTDDPAGVARLACPDCRAPIASHGTVLTCTGCNREFDDLEGVPLLVPRDLLGDAWKAQQAAFFDSDMEREWEITRPRGAPRLHRWILNHKFARSIDGLQMDLRNSSALVVCGGSGLDAEFLALRGCEVVVTDVSSGAMARAAERSRRNGFALTPIVADVERLPFADNSFDLVYVHDGLHHLADPYVGLSEMARVARVALSITEPSQALATRVAEQLGIAERVEEAGNKVMRLELKDVTRHLVDKGLRVTRASRYAVFYRHYPGWPSRFLSTGVLYPVVTRGITLANAAIGDFVGNKLTVQAVLK
jgi:ubiquinone/menaquinone biosynthesis C-methylase UbiE/uncharacterized protein YbaR (Trm112 family)